MNPRQVGLVLALGIVVGLVIYFVFIKKQSTTQYTPQSELFRNYYDKPAR